MNIGSLDFLIALLLISAVFWYLPGQKWRQGLLTACSGAFLYLMVANVASCVALAVFLLSGYAVGQLLRKRPSTSLLATYLFVLVPGFLVIRKYDLVTAHLPDPLAMHPVSIVGLSYMLFRQIQFLVDSREGQIERASLWSYLNFQLNLFTLLSGPIQRYQDYRDQWEKFSIVLRDSHTLRKAYFRLLTGVIKLAVFAPIFLSLYGRSAAALTPMPGSVSQLGPTGAIGHFLGILYFYPFYLYLNFSGYCDIVIAGSSLLGLSLPENFDQPYLARNVIDYWTRWHRTLGFWIRDYLFVPLYKSVAGRWPARADSLAFLCYFAAFFVAGIWHGPTANFVVYGLLQAIGVSAAKLWERHLLKRNGRASLKQYLQSHRIRALAVVCTLHFECISLLFFPVDINTTLQMFQTVLKTCV